MTHPFVAWRGELSLTVLSPVHIGSGEVLDFKLEYARRDGAVHRLDMEAFLGNRALDPMLKTGYFARDASLNDRRRAEIRAAIPARYRLDAPAGADNVREVREAIKLAGDRPYVPASSVKGALRTAFAREALLRKQDHVWDDLVEAAGQQRRDQFRAGAFEDVLFRGADLPDRRGKTGGDAKADALKGLVLRDSPPLPPTALQLRPFEIWDLHGRRFERDSGPFAFEALAEGADVRLPLVVSLDRLRPEGDYAPPAAVTEMLASHKSLLAPLRNWSLELLKDETEYFERAGAGEAARFVSGLRRACKKHEDGAVVPLGFGTGWNAKTLGPILDAEDVRKAGVRFHRGAPPPISRRLCLDKDGRPVKPPGWVWLRIIPK